MNQDDHNSNLHPLTDPELEARIVAWVAGEASAFETAELERLIAEKPELAIFKRRIEAVHGLVAEAARPDKAPLRLSDERRAKLLSALGASEVKTDPAPSAKVIAPSFEATKKSHRKDRQWLLAIAASLTVGVFTLISFPKFKRAYENGFAAKQEAPVLFELPASDEITPLAASVPTIGEVIEFPEQRKRERDSDAEFKNEPQSSLLDGQARYGGIILSEPSPKTRPFSTVAPKRKDKPSGPSAAQESSYDSYYSVQKTAAASSNGGKAVIAQQQASSATGETDASGSSYLPSTELSEDKLVLSPFTVTAPAEATGYTASNTLAGTRLQTDLRDVGATISGVTKEFLADTKSASTEQIFGYASRDEAGRFRGNSAVSGSLKGKKADEDRPLFSPKKPDPAASPIEFNAAKEPVSTFSLHVSDVSFRLAQTALANNELIDPARIRPEEFYNAFSYGDPTPTLAEKVSCRIEQAAHPFLQQRNLVRIALKVAASGRDAAQPLRLTILLDTSGSMEREDRAAIVRSAMTTLASLLGPNDRLTIIGFARQPSLLAESVAGDQVSEALELLAHIPAEGGTNLEEALKLGGELAQRQFDPSAQNRIVLLTDGAANLGNANPGQLATPIENLRQQGIAFDACGVGLEGLDDAMLENLTRKGDGRYYVLNSPEAADTGFAQQLAGALRPAAENVKLQVRFNLNRVGNYRLIGFERHRLREEDFRNDSVDAAELAAEEAAVAVYQVETLPQGEGELGEVYVRFRDATSKNMVERSWTLAYDPQSPAFERATPSMQLAGTAALLADKLRGGQAGDAIKLSDLAPVVAKLRTHYANEPRVQELITMFEQMRRQSGE